jgi:hypothetical protein
LPLAGSIVLKTPIWWACSTACDASPSLGIWPRWWS